MQIKRSTKYVGLSITAMSVIGLLYTNATPVQNCPAVPVQTVTPQPLSSSVSNFCTGAKITNLTDSQYTIGGVSKSLYIYAKNKKIILDNSNQNCIHIIGDNNFIEFKGIEQHFSDPLKAIQSNKLKIEGHYNTVNVMGSSQRIDIAGNYSKVNLLAMKGTKHGSQLYLDDLNLKMNGDYNSLTAGEGFWFANTYTISGKYNSINMEKFYENRVNNTRLGHLYGNRFFLKVSNSTVWLNLGLRGQSGDPGGNLEGYYNEIHLFGSSNDVFFNGSNADRGFVFGNNNVTVNKTTFSNKNVAICSGPSGLAIVDTRNDEKTAMTSGIECIK